MSDTPDIKVDYDFLSQLSNSLFALIDEFQGALDEEDKTGHAWGQLNANLSMNDFADNWTVSRNTMVDSLKSFRDNLDRIRQAWSDADPQLAQSLQEQN
jgi:predicted DNA-binding protein YlxM (UPF0122 family)